MQLRKLAVASLVAGTLAAGGITAATAASASTSGGTPPSPTWTPPTGHHPTPTVTPTTLPAPTHTPRPHPTPTVTITNPVVPTPTPTPVLRLRPERFSLFINNSLPNGLVLASGPVSFSNGRDQSVSPTLDIFSQGGRSVFVVHRQLPIPIVNRFACTLRMVQFGQPWSMIGRSGIYRFVRGFGTYNLSALFQFRVRRGVCTIPAVSPAQLRNEIVNNTLTVAPRSFSISVFGSGSARL